MKFKVLLEDEARSDIQKTALWYNSQSIGLGKKFVKSVRMAIKSIQTTPFGFVIKVGNFRGISLNKFPYLIYYQIDETNKYILIFAILHSHSGPDQFQKRIKAD